MPTADLTLLDTTMTFGTHLAVPVAMVRARLPRSVAGTGCYPHSTSLSASNVAVLLSPSVPATDPAEATA